MRILTLVLASAVLLIAETVAPDAKDPQYQAKGDQKRTYKFPGTGESIPYHLYVPSKWSKNSKLPLVVVLHGANQGADTVFERNEGILAKVAEKRGYIVVAPIGYRENGGYNNAFRIVPAVRPTGAAAPPPPPAAKGDKGKAKGAPLPPPTAEDKERSEQDVLNVADLVAKEYNADPKRIYLMGNSMGGGGTWYIGQKYPERWAAISPSAGPVSVEEYPYAKLKPLPVLILHGDADAVTSFNASKVMFEKAKAAGVNVQFLPIPGGDHYLAWTTVVPQVFEFFDKHKKK